MPKVKEIRLFDGYEKNAAYIVKEPNTNSSRRKRATKRALCTFLGIALVSIVVAVVIIIVVGWTILKYKVCQSARMIKMRLLRFTFFQNVRIFARDPLTFQVDVYQLGSAIDKGKI